jgi:hypothetical protein
MNAAKTSAWQADLIAKYPDLFNITFDGEVLATAYPAVGPGWRDLLERALARIAAALAGSPPDAFKLVQIKEKFASIRIYWHSDGLSEAAVASIVEAVDLAEARSACTCEQCGKAGELYVDDGWFRTACNEHAIGHRVPIKADWKNVVAVSRVVGGRLRAVGERRYLRDADAFEDIPISKDDDD